jgi:sugar phosphate permease
MSSLVTICMPFAADIHWIMFIILQILAGLAHGAIWPCTAVIMAHWVPAKERGKLMGFMNGGKLMSFA